MRKLPFVLTEVDAPKEHETTGKRIATLSLQRLALYAETKKSLTKSYVKYPAAIWSLLPNSMVFLMNWLLMNYLVQTALKASSIALMEMVNAFSFK